MSQRDFVNRIIFPDVWIKKMQKHTAATLMTTMVTTALLMMAFNVFIVPIEILTTALAQQDDEVSSINSQTGGNTNEPKEVTLDGVRLSFAVSPNDPEVSDLTTLTMNVTEAGSGTPITHVDWLIKIISPSGKEVFESSTQHSHMGKMQLKYAFQEPGNNTISVHIASLGPKMLGMDVPKMAQTRIFKSGDMMKSPDLDPTFFFGTREANFTVNVQPTTSTTASNVSGGSNQTGMITTTTAQNDITTSNRTSTVMLDGSEPDTKVKLEFSTNSQNITAGQPATLILRSKIAENNTITTHIDGLFTISKDGVKILESGPKGNPMMPMNGAFHGHTGEIAITMVFPKPGQYTVNATVNSDPKTVSNYVFGNLSPALFNVNIAEENMSTEATTNATSIKAVIPLTNEPNHIAIIGQEAPYFAPNNLKASPGTPITVKNHDAIAHTVTSTDATPNEQSPTANGTFDTGILALGQGKQITIDKEGAYNYFCQIHPFMRGTITVTS